MAIIITILTALIAIMAPATTIAAIIIATIVIIATKTLVINSDWFLRRADVEPRACSSREIAVASLVYASVVS
ncbi:MAG: hypothetical protein V1746_01145 [bacterium]